MKKITDNFSFNYISPHYIKADTLNPALKPTTGIDLSLAIVDLGHVQHKNNDHTKQIKMIN